MPYDNGKMNDYMKQRYNKRRQLAIEHLGGKCICCGSDEDLDFHHKDPSTKLFTIAKASSFGEERFWKEVAKCELLCRDCHTAHHKVEYPCGVVQSYWHGCRCDLCRAANAKHGREYKQKCRQMGR